MKNIIDIYEGILGNIEDNLKNYDIIDTLYDNLCNGTVESYKESAIWLKSMLDNKSNLKLSINDLEQRSDRKYSSIIKLYPIDNSKDYIEFISNPQSKYIIKIITKDIVFFLLPLRQLEKEHQIAKHIYTFDKKKFCFNSIRCENMYIIPEMLKPFVDKCINTIIKKSGTKHKINR